jgi:hypothetical protein
MSGIRLSAKVTISFMLSLIAGPDSRDRLPEVVEILGIKHRACECV